MQLTQAAILVAWSVAVQGEKACRRQWPAVPGHEVQLKVKVGGNSKRRVPVSGLSDGGAVVAFTTGEEEGVTAVVLNKNGLVAAESRVNVGHETQNQVESVTGLSNGNFVVTWIAYTDNGMDATAHAQLFDKHGKAAAAALPLSSRQYPADKVPFHTTVLSAPGPNGTYCLVHLARHPNAGASLHLTSVDSSGKVIVRYTTHNVRKLHHTAKNIRNPTLHAVSDGHYELAWEEHTMARVAWVQKRKTITMKNGKLTSLKDTDPSTPVRKAGVDVTESGAVWTDAARPGALLHAAREGSDRPIVVRRGSRNRLLPSLAPLHHNAGHAVAWRRPNGSVVVQLFHRRCIS